MDKKKIADDINKDIEKGIYEMFPKLKARLSFIAKKLFNSAYIINSEAQLSVGEIDTLIENEYLADDAFPEYGDLDKYMNRKNRLND